jgi:N-lysine methyltransferase SETD6
MDASPFATFLAFCEQHKIPVSPDVALVAVPGMGNGMVAVQPIPAHTELFSVPKTSILSTQMCELKDKLLESEWEGLNGGWGRLILCLMWEEGRGEASPWRGYLGELLSRPVSFSS